MEHYHTHTYDDHGEEEENEELTLDTTTTTLSATTTTVNSMVRGEGGRESTIVYPLVLAVPLTKDTSYCTYYLFVPRLYCIALYCTLVFLLGHYHYVTVSSLGSKRHWADFGISITRDLERLECYGWGARLFVGTHD
jgi:hypothetical protein